MLILLALPQTRPPPPRPQQIFSPKVTYMQNLKEREPAPGPALARLEQVFADQIDRIKIQLRGIGPNHALGPKRPAADNTQ